MQSGSAVAAGCPCDGVGPIIQDELPVEKRRQSTNRQVIYPPIHEHLEKLPPR
jgi:hypothetical protein